MKAILVKFHGPTAYMGSRVSASDLDGNKVTLHKDYALSHDENAREAVRELCRKMGWKGKLVEGSLGQEMVYVWVNGHSISQD